MASSGESPLKKLRTNDDVEMGDGPVEGSENGGRQESPEEDAPTQSFIEALAANDGDRDNSSSSDEDSDTTRREKRQTWYKEQLEKCKKDIQSLNDETNDKFSDEMKDLTKLRDERLNAIQKWYDCEFTKLKTEYDSQRKTFLDEYEAEKQDTKDRLMQAYTDRLKRLEEDMSSDIPVDVFLKRSARSKRRAAATGHNYYSGGVVAAGSTTEDANGDNGGNDGVGNANASSGIGASSYAFPGHAAASTGAGSGVPTSTRGGLNMRVGDFGTDMPLSAGGNSLIQTVTTFRKKLPVLKMDYALSQTEIDSDLAKMRPVS